MKIDFHVHSKFSKRPSQWILQKIGCPESFTDPVRLYQIARQRGMDWVTITDHNTLEGSQAIAMHSDASGIAAFEPQMDPDRLLPLLKAGLVSEEEIQQFRASRDAFLSAPRPYILMIGLMACGEKR